MSMNQQVLEMMYLDEKVMAGWNFYLDVADLDLLLNTL